MSLGAVALEQPQLNKRRVDEIVQDDRRVTVNTIARTLEIGQSAVQEKIEILGYKKVLDRYVQRY